MDTPLFIVSGQPVTPLHLLVGAAAVLMLLFVMLVAAIARTGRARRDEQDEAAERQHDLDAKMAALARSSAELTGRMQTIAEVFGTRQADLARLVSERLDAVGHRVGQGIESSAKTTGENLTKLNERLAVIDAAQGRLSDLTQEVLGLKDILANKQARGAFGQGRMEAIIRDALPASAYEFQHTLSNRMRPDCCIRLPGDHRMMVIDAKFPLESFTALKAAAGDEAALRQAMARVRGDVGKHIKDIAERYFLPGETQDIAMMFVPSESLYAEINETFEDVVAKAHKAQAHHRLAFPADDGGAGDAGDRPRRSRARAGARHPERGALASRRRRPPARARGKARHAFPPGGRGRGGHDHLGGEGAEARRAHRRDGFHRKRTDAAGWVGASGGVAERFATAD